MLEPPLISVPLDHSLRPESPWSTSSQSAPRELSAPPRFPHTRAQLSAIARQYRPTETNYDDDYDADDSALVTSALVTRVASLLDNEHEDELKSLLRSTFSSGIDDDELSQHVLDLMHRHRDDVDNIPFLYLTPNRRPISRPSSRASSHSVRLNRPDTPTNSAPSSPLAILFRRPHTPLSSPLGNVQASSYILARTESSPGSSPILTHAQFTASLPASPISSPRILNAKASEFKPIPRPLSAASSNPGSLASLRADTPSPDMWAHNPQRPTSKLAIAAPLTPDSSLLTRSLTPSSSLRSSLRPDDDDDDDDEDPFDPFNQKALPRSFHPPNSDIESQWSNSPISNVSISPEEMRYHYSGASDFSPSLGVPSSQGNSADNEIDSEAAVMLTDGMTPFDVLSSVFGATLAPSELEEALAQNGYDFERAMNWLVDRASANQAAKAPATRLPSVAMGNRVMMIPRDGSMRGGRGFNNFMGSRGMRYNNGRPSAGGNRVCRYFLAGECLRADCRFSHDLERALCRFWLRGTCAKGDACEFLHHLPKDIDVNGLTNAIGRVDLNGSIADPVRDTPQDEFPALGYNGTNGTTPRRDSHSESVHDPSRTRFSAAVKRPAPYAHSPQTSVGNRDPALVAARREAMGPSAAPLHHSVAIIAPKPSPRIKLRLPTLLPTLPTGEVVNSLYMTYRSRALQLGAARNACLSRAADAWRRGDGAAAKRFSREGHDLNAKMSTEMNDAAGKLVRERAKVAEQAVRNRDPSWSDDYGDRAARGKLCGAGLGVCLGIASPSVAGEGQKSTPEERTECMLDLHGLHSTEATEVLEEFLLALEREHFYGIAYLVVGEEKHTGTQDPARGASRARLATGVREWLHHWGYPWLERDGVICIDPLTHI
ncbi:hypothetical protein BXZ70DRAFT_377025 [Cristinia sonorae]|uniref:Uncharacterized protein n=1 Tax=Cristinia sonorae TaxID=1940300 RepID=A0A8K0XML6_9AGAR|nr:hypothetical protein BXZ70DRAFT_377025 [Cristinia sonorae]